LIKRHIYLEIVRISFGLRANCDGIVRIVLPI